MPSFTFSGEAFASAFASLGEKYAVWGPKRLKGRGRFFGTDLITYAPLQTFDELETDEKSAMSPKSVVFPPDETLFHFTGDQFSEPPLEDGRETIVFLRPCDINGFRRLDAMFLENGGTPDPFYRRRREKLHFFMIECRESFENCFCVSMGSNATDNYAAAFRFGEDSVEVEVKDPRFAQDFSSGAPSDFATEFVKENFKKVTVPEVEEMPPELFSSPLWDEYESRCISCGRCNTSCVTCTCFSSLDLFYSDSRSCGERRRVWDGCHLDGFTDMAGGHSFRKKKSERMRFKTFHKIYDFRKRFGFHMCVGCGRCDDVCPEYISFSECINRVSEALKGGDAK